MATHKKKQSIAPKSVTDPIPTASPNYSWMPYVAAALALALYATGLNNALVSMDDHTATVNNEAVRQFPFKLFSHFNLGMYAPLTWFGYGIAYTLGKESPFWYHLLSAVVHAVNAILVFRLFRHLMPHVWAAFGMAVFFAVHPLQVEAVSWIAGFSTPLFSMFSLLACLAYVRHARAERTWGAAYWWALAAFVAACLAKSAAATLPLTLVALDVWLKRSWRSTTVLLEKVPFVLVALVFGALTVYSRQQAGHSLSSSTETYSLADRVLMVSHTVLFYWTKLLAPIGLSVWYPFEKNAAGQWPMLYYAAPFMLAGVVVMAWWVRHRFVWAWYGLLWYGSNVALALPFYTIGTFELRSDRYNYLACLGFFAVLWGIWVWVKDRRPSLSPVILGVFGAMTLAWSVLTVQRIGEWRDSEALFQASIDRQGDNFGKAWLWLGMQAGKKGQVPSAIDYLTRAIERNPALTEAYKYRGGLWGVRKEYQKAIDDLTVYIQRQPNEAEIYYNRGLSYLNLGQQEAALADLDRCIALQPSFARAYQTRARLHQSMGQADKAAADQRAYEQYNQKR